MAAHVVEATIAKAEPDFDAAASAKPAAIAVTISATKEKEPLVVPQSVRACVAANKPELEGQGPKDFFNNLTIRMQLCIACIERQGRRH